MPRLRKPKRRFYDSLAVPSSTLASGVPITHLQADGTTTTSNFPVGSFIKHTSTYTYDLVNSSLTASDVNGDFTIDDTLAYRLNCTRTGQYLCHFDGVADGDETAWYYLSHTLSVQTGSFSVTRVWTLYEGCEHTLRYVIAFTINAGHYVQWTNTGATLFSNSVGSIRLTRLTSFT